MPEQSNVNDDMIKLAKFAVSTAKEKFSRTLDFSEKTLPALDSLLDQAYSRFSDLAKQDKLRDESVRYTAKVWGSYLGEVIRLNLGGQWLQKQDDSVIMLNDRKVAPIEYVYRRITREPEYKLIQYYDEILLHNNLPVQIEPQSQTPVICNEMNNLPGDTKPNSAIQQALDLVLQHPEIHIGHMMLARAYHKADMIDAAVAEYRAALSTLKVYTWTDPPSFDIWLDQDDARLAYKAARFNLGGIAALRGQIAEALDEYKILLSVIPNCPEAREKIEWLESFALDLMPYLKPQIGLDYLNQIPAEDRDRARFVMQPFEDELNLATYLAIDAPSRVIVVSKAWLMDRALEEDFAFKIALENLKRRTHSENIRFIHDAEGNVYSHTVYYDSGKDGYDASRILLPSFRSDICKRLGVSQCYIGIPLRDYLTATLHDPDRLDVFREQMEQLITTSDHPLCTAIFGANIHGNLWLIDSGKNSENYRAQQGVPARDNTAPSDFRSFHGVWSQKVAGVTHDDRQRIVDRLKIGETIRFRLDPLNMYDHNAVIIETMHGEQFGFVPKEYSAQVSAILLPLGGSITGWVEDLTGGAPAYPNRGVVVSFGIPDEADGGVVRQSNYQANGAFSNLTKGDTSQDDEEQQLNAKVMQEATGWQQESGPYVDDDYESSEDDDDDYACSKDDDINDYNDDDFDEEDFD